MHASHIANTIAKRRRELDVKLEMSNTPLKQMSALGEFLAEMDMLVARIRADERNSRTDVKRPIKSFGS